MTGPVIRGRAGRRPLLSTIRSLLRPRPRLDHRYSILPLALPPMSTGQLANRPAITASVPLWVFLGLPIVWFLNLRLLLSHDPLARAIKMGADVAKEQALGAIPQEWMGWLAQPVITTINQYVGPYALAGEAFMTSWALVLTLLLPACFTLGAFGVIQLGLLVTGGASGGWKATARALLLNHLFADLAVLAWLGLLLSLKLSLLSQCFGLFGGLLFIRFIAQVWLLAQVVRTHSLGALRIIFLGIPALLIAIVIAWFVATATGSWLICDFVLAALR